MIDPDRIEKRWDMGPCCVCGRLAVNVYGGGAVRLKNGSPICGNCVRKLRPLYPLVSERMKTGEAKHHDPLGALLPEEAKTAAAQAIDGLEALRARYAPYHAVFRIDAFRVEKQGLFKPPRSCFTGFGLYGRFDPGDRVKLLHDGAVTEMTIEELQSPFPLQGEVGEAGYQLILTALQKNIEARSGDLIVKA